MSKQDLGITVIQNGCKYIAVRNGEIIASEMSEEMAMACATARAEAFDARRREGIVQALNLIACDWTPYSTEQLEAALKVLKPHD